MTVDAYSECPICGGDITKEPHTESKIEKYKLNKYFFIHLIKKHKFPIVCTIIALTIIFVSIKSFGLWQILSLFLTAFMWVESLFKNLIYEIFSLIYSDYYLESNHKITIYLCGVFAIIMALIPNGILAIINGSFK